MFRKTVAVIVGCGLALGVGSVVLAQSTQGGAKPEAAKPSTASQTGDAQKPAEAKKSAEKVMTVSGKVKSVAVNSLVVQVSGKTPKEYAFDLTGAKIKVAGKDAIVADLKEGDAVRVSYLEADGKLIAKTVTARAKAEAKVQK